MWWHWAVWSNDAPIVGLSPRMCIHSFGGWMVKVCAFVHGTKTPVRWLVLVWLGWALAGCGGLLPRSDEAEGADASPAVELSAPAQARAASLLKTPVRSDWAVYRWPGKRMAAFVPDRVMGRNALRVDASSTVSVLRQRFDPALPKAAHLRFAWKAQSLPVGANLRDGAREDSAVRVVLAFDGDRSRLSDRALRLSDLSQALTGEPLPYATLVYVWSETEPVGTVIHNPRTDRIRKLVVSSGADALGQWKDHHRDLRADFEQAFGEPPGPLLSVALMSDTDNTRSRTRAWFGALELTEAPR